MKLKLIILADIKKHLPLLTNEEITWSKFAELLNEAANKALYKHNVSGWVATSQMPDYDGQYLCYVRHPQECGNIWEYQKVVQCSINTWAVTDGEQVTHWMALPEPPCR
jgi:hypothetical protein